MVKKLHLFLLIFIIILSSFSLTTNAIAQSALYSGSPAGNGAYPLFTSSTPSIEIENTNEFSNENELWSKEKICKFVNGCYDSKRINNGCYPFGYIKENTTCFNGGFVERKSSGECSYNFIRTY